MFKKKTKQKTNPWTKLHIMTKLNYPYISLQTFHPNYSHMTNSSHVIWYTNKNHVISEEEVLPRPHPEGCWDDGDGVRVRASPQRVTEAWSHMEAFLGPSTLLLLLLPVLLLQAAGSFGVSSRQQWPVPYR